MMSLNKKKKRHPLSLLTAYTSTTNSRYNIHEQLMTCHCRKNIAQIIIVKDIVLINAIIKPNAATTSFSESTNLLERHSNISN